jgi:hypothetical protein
METSTKVTGSCLCGSVHFEAYGPPRRVTHCHCTMCRRATGAVAGTFTTWDVRDARFIGKLAPLRFKRSASTASAAAAEAGYASDTSRGWNGST